MLKANLPVPNNWIVRQRGYYRTTVPIQLMNLLGWKDEDLIGFKIEGDKITIKKLEVN